MCQHSLKLKRFDLPLVLNADGESVQNKLQAESDAKLYLIFEHHIDSSLNDVRVNSLTAIYKFLIRNSSVRSS
jgi:hypothetical protein